MTTEIANTGGALAVRPDQTEWTPAQAAVLQQSGISNEVTAAELSGFLHLCQRTQLDPFSRQIYLIGRWDKRVDRKVFTPQTGIDGYRVVAHRVVDASGEAFGYEDTVWCDSSGRWRDVWLSPEPPAATKVTVLRRGQRFSAVALFREYVQTNSGGYPTGMWGKMPAGQLAKCAEALALRKAFPHDLAGVYTAEEMAQADNTTPAATSGAAEARHLRTVQQASDPSQAPAADAEATPVIAVNLAAQKVADTAAKALDRTEGRRCWSLGASGRLLQAPVNAPDSEELEQLGDYLTRRLAELPEAADERTQAIGALEGAGAAAGLSEAELTELFFGITGLPVEQASTGAIVEAAQIIRRSAA